MRIALDCSHYLIPGGIRNRTANLLAAMATIAPENEYLLYFRRLSRPTEFPALPAGTRSRVVFAQVPRRLLSFCENRLGWPPVEYWTGAIDAFHGTHFVVPAARAARLVLTVHDVTYLRHPAFYADRKGNDYGYHYLLTHSLRRAHRVIAISQATRRDLIALCDVAPERIWVIPSGADPRLRRLPAAEYEPVLDRLGIQRPYVVYPVGTIDIRKNLAAALEAYARALPDRAERPLLVLTGVGDLPADITQLAERLGLTEHLRPLRVSYPDELTALMSGALWGMYLSLYEGFGLPPLEAMACGMPLVVSNVSSIPEVVGDAALLVDPHNVEEMAGAMARLHTDESLRRDLADRGARRAAAPAFSWERAARQTLAAYRDDEEAYRAEEQPNVTG